MTYGNFKDAVLSRLSREFSPPAQITIQSIQKNNGITSDGLLIREGGRNIAPSLYLNQYYESCLHGHSLDEVCANIIESYRQHRPAESVNTSFFTEYALAEPTLSYRLINYGKNRDLLRMIPHVRYLDLAIVFACLYSLGAGSGSASILIRHIHLKHWGVSVRDIWDAASKNTPLLLSPCIRDMSSILLDMDAHNPRSIPAEPNSSLLQDFNSAPDASAFGSVRGASDNKSGGIGVPPDAPLYVLSNHQNFYGAACILYKDLLGDFAEQIGSDLYILPSSVHEVILLADYGCCTKDKLAEIICDVNRTHLLPEEILSDHPYRYCRDLGDIII